MTNGVPEVFNNADVVADGWYWALPSAKLARGDKRELQIFGDTLLLYRSNAGFVHCVQAYCPHMGAHLKEGNIEGEDIRCGFHGWKFSGDGACMDIPCSSVHLKSSSIAKIKNYHVQEKFGMIWIYSNPTAVDTPPLPSFNDLEGHDVTVHVDVSERRNCHPTLILGGGVDEEHFLFVHRKTTAASGPLNFSYTDLSPSVIHFENIATITGHGFKTFVLRFLYGKVLRYDVTYWYASTALSILGFPWLPLYAIFAYRPTTEGRTEGLNIYLTPRRRGPLGWLKSFFALHLTRAILRKGGGEDRVIQNSIRFQPSPYAFGNPPFRAFLDYVERQPTRRLRTQQTTSEAPWP